MQPKSIVVNYPGRKGGGAVYAYEMTKGLIENNCKVYAIIASGIENLQIWRELELEQIFLLPTYSNKFEFLINTFKFCLFGIKELRKKFKDLQIDAVYVPMIQPWTPLINKAVNHGIKKIVTVHDPCPHSGSSKIFDLICKYVSKDADEIILLSETFRNCSKKFFNKNDKNVHVIPHGKFDFYKSVQLNSNTCNYDKNKTNFLFFGRITKYKGLHILARAYKKLLIERKDVTLTIVGDGEFSEYEKEFSELENVKIVNRWIKDEEVGCFFSGENIITVLPYTDATQSGVIPIAMEYKSLVIASATGGLKEQVQNKITGYLFESDNVDELYQTMSHVCINVTERKQFVERAYEFNKKLDWINLARKLKSII